jgi:hypothetical protein
MDIIPFPSYTSNDAVYQRLEVGSIKAILALGNPWDWCLLSVEVQNSSGLTFDVAFSCMEHSGTTCTTIPPGSTSTVLLPIRKIILPESQINRPIPQLPHSQIAGANCDLAETGRMQRELFWYRGAVLDSIHGEWSEVSLDLKLV